jgi:hypothetical protein
MVEVTGTKGVGFSTGDTMIGVGRSGVEMASSLRVNVALTSREVEELGENAAVGILEIVSSSYPFTVEKIVCMLVDVVFVELVVAFNAVEETSCVAEEVG